MHLWVDPAFLYQCGARVDGLAGLRGETSLRTLLNAPLRCLCTGLIYSHSIHSMNDSGTKAVQALGDVAEA